MKEKSSEFFFFLFMTAKYAIHDEINTQPPKIHNKKLSAMIKKKNIKKCNFPNTMVFQVKAHILQE